MVEADAAVWSGWLDVVMSIISPVFGQARSRKAAFAYVQALLRADGRRSCWQLAELAGHASPRRLQALLADYVWDAQVLAERVRAFLLDALADPEAVLAIDETAELKAGSHTVAVAPQYAGITGQVENCQTVVFLAYVTARAHALMDPPPPDHGMIKVSIAEARRLLAIATSTATTTVKLFYLHWSDWRRRHQARARWHHWRTRLRRYATT
jgi:hypothetical protein